MTCNREATNELKFIIWKMPGMGDGGEPKFLSMNYRNVNERDRASLDLTFNDFYMCITDISFCLSSVNMQNMNEKKKKVIHM